MSPSPFARSEWRPCHQVPVHLFLGAAVGLPQPFKAMPWVGPIGIPRTSCGQAFAWLAIRLRELGFDPKTVIVSDPRRGGQHVYSRGPRFDEALAAALEAQKAAAARPEAPVAPVEVGSNA